MLIVFFAKIRPVRANDVEQTHDDRQHPFEMAGSMGYYTSLASLEVSPPSNTDERRSALNKGLMNFAMPNIFLTVSQNAEVVHQEFVVEQGKEMLLALVHLPGLSGAFDLRTNEKFDAYPAILLLAEDGYMIVLRVQSNFTDLLQTSEPKDKASHSLEGLLKLKSGLEVRSLNGASLLQTTKTPR